MDHAEGNSLLSRGGREQPHRNEDERQTEIARPQGRGHDRNSFTRASRNLGREEAVARGTKTDSFNRLEPAHAISNYAAKMEPKPMLLSMGSNLPPLVSYLIGIVAIMVGSILFVGAWFLKRRKPGLPPVIPTMRDQERTIPSSYKAKETDPSSRERLSAGRLRTALEEARRF